MTDPLIIHIIDELKMGGAQTHLVTMLGEAVGRYRARHRVVSLFGDGPIAQELEALDVPVDRLDLRSALQHRRFDAAAAEVGRLLRRHRPEVVEAHLTWSRLLSLPAAVASGARLRVGYEQGDIFNDSMKFRVANFLGQAFAHHIVVCSHALEDWVHETHRVSRNKLMVLHNCVDVSRFSPPGHTDRPADLDLPPCETLFAAVGTLGRGVNKRVDVGIRALGRARESGHDVGLVVCGDGDQRSELEALVEELGIAPFVRFLGLRSDVPRILSACDAFCHAAPFEPFGIVCIEAMAVELPVVVPDTGGMQEAVEHGTTGLVYRSLSAEKMAEALGQLASDPDARRRMGKAARRAVLQGFTSARYVERLYGVYGIERCKEATARAPVSSAVTGSSPGMNPSQ